VRNTSGRGKESRFHEGQSRHLPIAPKPPVLVVTAVVDDVDATRNNVNSNGNAGSLSGAGRSRRALVPSPP
jgi:hypothetical protein